MELGVVLLGKVLCSHGPSLYPPHRSRRTAADGLSDRKQVLRLIEKVLSSRTVMQEEN